MSLDNELGQLIAQASELLASSQPEDTVELLKSQYDKYNDNPVYLQSLGESLLEVNDMENAYETLNKACNLDPDASYGVEKFLYLGQIIGSEEGVKSLTIALEKILNQLKIVDGGIQMNEPNEEFQVLLNAYGSYDQIRRYLIKKLNQSIFAVIEIWMTDLCMEEQAEQECERLIQLALQTDSKNPETWCLLSSIRISQQRNDAAKEAIEKSWNLFSDKISELEDVTNNAQADTDISEAQSEYVEMEQPLITLAKYAVEMGLFEAAIAIASSAQDINEQSVESFYLEGFSSYLNAIRLQNSMPDESGYQLSQNFQDYSLNTKVDKSDESWSFINDSRVALSNAFKLLQVDSIDAITDDELKTTVNSLLEHVGGFLMKEKDISNINENNWEDEIPMDE